jgi:RNA polymerase sigma factor (sigma-70 family)
MSKTDYNKILQDCANGDYGGIGEYQDSLLNILKSLYPGGTGIKTMDLEDVAQEAMVRILQNIADFVPKNERSAISWGLAIARRIIANEKRKWSKRPRSFDIYGGSREGWEVMDWPLIDFQTAAQILGNGEQLQKQLRNAQLIVRNALDERVYHPFELRCRGLTHEQIAAAMGLNKGRVDNYLCRDLPRQLLRGGLDPVPMPKSAA